MKGGAVALFAKPPVTVETFTAQAQKKFGERAQEFLAVYPAGDG